MSLGPLQIMIVNFDDANFSGEIEAELRRLEQADTLRVLDAVVVAKSDEGEVTVVRTHEAQTGELGAAVLGLDLEEPHEPGEDDADVWYAADAIAPGGAAAVIVLEHRWATGLRDAILGAGGRDVATEWVDEAELTSLGVALPTD